VAPPGVLRRHKPAGDWRSRTGAAAARRTAVSGRERSAPPRQRDGTQTLFANCEGAKGKIVAPSIGPTRTEAEFAAHIAKTIATDPKAEWVFLVDLLNTHQSEALVRLVAEQCQIEIDLSRIAKAIPHVWSVW